MSASQYTPARARALRVMLPLLLCAWPERVAAQSGMEAVRPPSGTTAPLRAGAADSGRHVVLISVDGLRPDFYLQSRWPAVMLRRMAQEGAHAQGVRSVHPSVTYAAHTTIVTGAMPARHGVYYNSPFESSGQTGRWYWEANSIKVPTLWDAVSRAGFNSAALWWPVTVDAPITWNVPEIWPLDNSDRTASLRAATRPQDFLAELEQQAIGPMDDSFRGAVLSRDDRMAAMAAYTLRTKRPRLMLVHFTTTDSHQHSYGREHHLVERAVQTVDRGIARIVEAAEDAGILDRTTFIVTGDHGFSDIHTVVAPNVWLRDAGLMEDRKDRGRWRATFHTSGASAFLMLRDSSDTAAVRLAREAILQQPAAVRRYLRFVDGNAMREIGADPHAPFSVSGVDGVSMTSAATGPALRPGSGGTHGHYPGFPNIRTGFVAWGAGISPGARVEEMSLADIAPLVARLLGLSFTAPDGVLIPGLLRENATAHDRAFGSADALANFFRADGGERMLISAHRGGPGPGFPDNAIETFARATTFGPMLLELDVRRSADGQLVVLHDEDVSIRSNGSGRAAALTLDSLQRLRLRDDRGTLTSSRVPSLAQVLEWARGRAVLRLDVKSGVTADEIVRAIEAAKAFSHTMAIARSVEEVTTYQRLAPQLMLSFWFDPDRNGRLSMDELQQYVRLPIDHRRVVVGVGSEREGWDGAVLDTLRARGLRGMVSSFGVVDSTALATGDWRPYCRYVQAGVGVLITDAAEAAARAARECAVTRRSTLRGTK